MARKPIPEVNGWGDEIVTALGALVIRASQHEAALVSLFCAIADTSRRQAGAIFYASVNAKARLDTMRALVAVSDFLPSRRLKIIGFLDRAKDLADRRNIYIHSEHALANYQGGDAPPRPVMTQYQSATKKLVTRRQLDLDHLHLLLDQYQAFNRDALGFATDLRSVTERHQRRMAAITRNASARPASITLQGEAHNVVES
jgi:hypothetical protein